MRLLPLMLLAVHTIADPHQLHQLQRALRSADQSGALDYGDHGEDCGDGMMILTYFNVDLLISLVHDSKLVHLYVEDKEYVPKKIKDTNNYNWVASRESNC